MSESAEFPDVLLTVSAKSTFDDDDEALEALVQLKDLDFEHSFDERETQLDNDESESILIRFYQDEGYNSLNLTAGPDSDVRINLSLVDDAISDGSRIMTQITERISGVELDHIDIYREMTIPFGSLDLPIVEGEGCQVTGIKLRSDEVDYIIQEEEEGTSVHASWDEISGDTESIIENLGQAQVDQATEFVESFS